jgi:PAS domain S-box-containing protein
MHVTKRTPMECYCSARNARMELLAATIFLVLCSSLVLPQEARAQTVQVKRILIVNEAGVSYPAIDLINQSIQKELQNSPDKIEIYSEYLETILFPDPATQQEFRTFILHKYQNRKPDVIISVGPSALQFLQEVHKTAFKGIPLVFCLPSGSVPGSPMLDSDSTGVANDISAGTTLEAALRLQPHTEHVFVVGGQGNFDKQLQVAVREQLKPFASRLDIVYLTSMGMADLLERLRHLPPRSVVVLTTVAQDTRGQRFKSNESGPLVVSASNAPVFSLFDVYLNHGEVGGDLSSFSEQGRIAGSMALRTFNGERAQDIPRVKDVMTYMFDARALQRWGFKERNLPAGSVLINRQPSFWELNKGYVLAAALGLLAQTFVILGLLWQRAKRKNTENELESSNERLRAAVENLRESEERFRLVANTAPVMIWMSGIDKLRTYFNQPWLDFTGRALAEELGNGWAEGVHAQDLDQCLKIYTQRFDARESFEMEYRLRRSDGEYRWIVDLGVPRFSPDGAFAGYIGSCLDVTERKLAQEALSTVSRRLIEAHEEERTWLARELHDDVDQRLALVTVNLDVLKREIPDSADEALRQVSDVREQLKDLGSDVQALSHRLHSSKLQYLGLTAAARAFCREFSERKSVQIDLECDAFPRTTPEEISLCLFRVLQEALQNASKHSGSQHYQVSIRYVGTNICLTVSDSGIGFDLQQAMCGRGLGITSMRERLKLVDGELTIGPQTPSGTVVRARVPIPTAIRSASA